MISISSKTCLTDAWESSLLAMSNALGTAVVEVLLKQSFGAGHWDTCAWPKLPLINDMHYLYFQLALLRAEAKNEFFTFSDTLFSPMCEIVTRCFIWLEKLKLQELQKTFSIFFCDTLNHFIQYKKFFFVCNLFVVFFFLFYWITTNSKLNRDMKLYSLYYLETNLIFFLFVCKASRVGPIIFFVQVRINF